MNGPQAAGKKKTRRVPSSASKAIVPIRDIVFLLQNSSELLDRITRHQTRAPEHYQKVRIKIVPPKKPEAGAGHARHKPQGQRLGSILAKTKKSHPKATLYRRRSDRANPPWEVDNAALQIAESSPSSIHSASLQSGCLRILKGNADVQSLSVSVCGPNFDILADVECLLFEFR